MHPSRPCRPPAFPLAILGLLTAALVVAMAVAVLPANAAPRNVQNGSLNWGVRQSFRSYIAGPIAHGSATLSGGASTNPDGTYQFPVSGGSYDPDTGALNVQFFGSIHFLGHDYGNGSLLNLKFSNFRVEASGSTGTLYADALSAGLESADANGMPGPLESFPGVALANVSGISPSISGDSVSVSGATATLASAGVAAFASFYTAGEALDPVSLSFTLAPVPTSTPTNTPTPAPTTPPATTTSTATATATATATRTATATPPATVTPIPVGNVASPAELDPAVAPVTTVLASGAAAALTGPLGETLMSASFVDTNGGSAAVVLARYADGWSPASGAALGAGGHAFELHVAPSAAVGPNALLSVTFSGLTPNQPLVWWNGASWLPVTSSGAAVQANAAGQASVLIGPDSSPTLWELTGTPIGTRAAGAQTSTATATSTTTATATATGTSPPAPTATNTPPPSATGTATALASPSASPSTPTTVVPAPRPPATGSGLAAAVPFQWIALVSVLAFAAGLGALSTARFRARTGGSR